MLILAVSQHRLYDSYQLRVAVFSGACFGQDVAAKKTAIDSILQLRAVVVVVHLTLQIAKLHRASGAFDVQAYLTLKTALTSN
jgi:hypothetical protein